MFSDKPPVAIILPPVWSAVYLNVARLMKYSFEDHGYQTEIRQWGAHRSEELNIVLGWNILHPGIEIYGKYIFYQLEPMNQPTWQEKYDTRKNIFDKAFAIWDYSTMNISLLDNIHRNVSHVPLGFHNKLIDVTPTPFPDFDVLFTGNKTKRRIEILSDLQNKCGVSSGQKWGRDLTEAISRSKILQQSQFHHFSQFPMKSNISKALIKIKSPDNKSLKEMQ